MYDFTLARNGGTEGLYVMRDHSLHGIDDDDSTSVLVMRSSRYNGGRHADEVMRLGGGW
jgi:hypothetical protein